MTAFDRAIAFTLGEEGGIANRLIDRGGFTNRGITQGLYDRWRRKHGLAQQSVRLVTDDEIRAIAQEEFWAPCRCDELQPALALAVFDMAFNSGPGDAVKALQVAVGAKPDGSFGPNTLAAVRRAGPNVVLHFLKARGAHIQDVITADPPQVGNLEGWINRLLDQAVEGQP